MSRTNPDKEEERGVSGGGKAMSLPTEDVVGALLAVLAVLARFGLSERLTDPSGLLDGWIQDLQFALGGEEEDHVSDEMAEATAGRQVAPTGDGPASPGGDAVAVRTSQGNPCVCCGVRQA